MFYQSSRSATPHPESTLQPDGMVTVTWNLCGGTMDKTLISYLAFLVVPDYCRIIGVIPSSRLRLVPRGSELITYFALSL
jgi:hypothetical protein